MELKEIIKRCRELRLSSNQIGFILEMDPDTVNMIVEKNGWASKTKPNSLPDSYFIQRLTEGVTVADMAKELECTRAAIYRLLKRRGISQDALR